MLARIVGGGPVPAPARRNRLRRRWVAFLAAAAAAATVLALWLPAGRGTPPAGAPPDAAGVRSLVLAAFARTSNVIAYSAQVWTTPGQPTFRTQTWTYPAAPAPGEEVRFRQFIRENGAPFQDVEFIYRARQASDAIRHPIAASGVRGEAIDVEYPTRTWSRRENTAIGPGPVLGPAQIRQQIASGRFSVAGRASLNGRPVIELAWADGPGATARLWVDAQTYLPLRSRLTTVTDRAGRRVTTSIQTTVYHSLPATPGNLDLLTPPIPSGFARTPRPPAHPHG